MHSQRSGVPGLDPELLVALWEQIDQPLAILDEGGTLIAANPAFGALAGRAPADLAGRALADLSAAPPALTADSGGAVELVLEGAVGAQRVTAHVGALRSNERPLLLLRAGVAEPALAEGQRRARQAGADERERLGRELHDALGQSLDYILSQAEGLRGFLASGRLSLAAACLPPLIAALQEARRDLDGMIDGAATARPPLPLTGDAPSFAGRLRAHLEWLGQLYAMPIALDLEPAFESVALPPASEPALLQIVRELLDAIRRRSARPAAQIRCAQAGAALEIVVRDLGGGPAAAEDDPAEQRRLQILASRAEQIGGSLAVEAQRAGYLVRLRAPLQPAERPGPQGPRVLVVDDSPLFASGLRQLLAARGFRVVGTAVSGAEALERARRLRPDIILMDVNMPDGDGISATAQIAQALPEAQIVMLTVSDEEATLFDALRAGAVGYLLKGLDADELQSRLLGLTNGEVALAPQLARRVLRAFSHGSAPDLGGDEARLLRLTPRQIDVLALASQGQTYKEIGRALGYSERSIKYFMGSIIRQLQLESRADAISYARRLMERGAWPPPAQG